MKSPRLAVVVALFAGVLVVGAAATQTVAAADIATTTCDPVGATEATTDSALDSFEPMLAERVVDTRSGLGGVSGALEAGCTLIVDTSSIAPTGAEGVALSVTVVSQSQGFFTAFPCAQGRPGTSSVNARPGLPTANLVLVAPDSTGKVCLYSNGGGQVVMDVSGWFAPGTNRFAPVDPVRAFDSRQLAPPIKRPAGDVRDIDVAGTLVPAEARAVAVNIAAVDPNSRGFLVVFPCGQQQPLASNVNFVAGEKRAVSAIVEVGVDGKICITGNAETHYIVDVTGYYAPTSVNGPAVDLTPSDDTRVVDTRDRSVAGVRFAAGSTQRFDLSRSLDRADETVAAVLNVAATRADAGGFLTIYPCSADRPTTSALNYDLGQTANLVVAPLSTDGEVCVYASTSTDLVVDLVGAFAGPSDSLANQVTFVSNDGPADIDQPFTVDGSDYTIHCPTGGVAFDVRLGLAPGATATVNGSPATGFDTPVDIPEDGLVTIALRRGSERATYHYRCVPMDFPEYVTTRSGNADGWYMTELGWNNPVNGRFLAILDARGVPVWYKRTARKPATGVEEKLIDFQLLSTGDLLASPINGRGFGIDPDDGHRVFGLDGRTTEVLPTIDPKPNDDLPFPSDHHDYVEIPGAGSTRGRAVVVYPLVKDADLSSLTSFDPVTGKRIDPRCNYDTQPNNRWVVDGTIQEILPSGQTWEWNALDHFDYDEITYAQCFGNYTNEPGYEPPPNGPNGQWLGGEVDAIHINSLQRVDEPNCEPECDYIVSARHLDSVFRVDRATDKVDWILSGVELPSGTRNAGKRLTILNDPLGGPLRMHDARFINGLLTMYDNRTGTNDPSRVVAYRIDATAGTATLVSEIDHPEGKTSLQLGSLRGTPDNTLMVGWGTTQPIFAEYATSGRELLRIEMTPDDAAFRINKYAPGTFDAAELRANAGGFIR